MTDSNDFGMGILVGLGVIGLIVITAVIASSSGRQSFMFEIDHYGCEKAVAAYKESHK